MLAALLAWQPAWAQENLAEHPVYQAFEAYRAAILTSEADDALGLVDSATIGYYGTMLDYARTLGEEKARALDVMDLLMVLSIRHRLSEQQVKTMDAETLFKHGVAHGWIGRESVASFTITGIETDGDVGFARTASRGVEVPFPFRFHREQGRWKIDLTGVMDASGAAFSQLAKQQGMTEVELIFYLLETVSEKEIDEKTIWTPIHQR